MISLTNMYDSILLKIEAFNNDISKAELKIYELNQANSSEINARISNLEELLTKIDDYLVRVRGFQELAKKNLESPNVLSIEAYPGYRVNLNRLRNWSMMIDPSSSNDPYAQRVYVVAKCDECFLLQKQKEFKEKIALLKDDSAIGVRAEVEQLKERITNLKKELVSYAFSEEIGNFAREVIRLNSEYWLEGAPNCYSDTPYLPKNYAFGAFLLPLEFDKQPLETLKGQFGRFLNVDKKCVMLPAEIQADKEFVILVNCIPSKRNYLDSGLQNVVLSLIDKAPAGMQKVFIIDALRYSTASMGSIRQLEDTFAMSVIPRNQDRLTETLEEIVSSFSDMDDILGLSDSVRIFNKTADDSKKLSFSTIIVFGWPNSYEGRNRELLLRIMNNYERYGISLILVSYTSDLTKKSDSFNDIPEYALYNSIRVKIGIKENTIAFPDELEKKFTWYTFSGNLPLDYVSSLKEHKIGHENIGNEYTKRYSMSNLVSGYSRKYKPIELPFGIDMKDEAYNISFENENFAAYLVGASRSGKSTLLHTLIAGLIRQYHPDNLELWLADFKQLEFKRYMKHLPPHVKYILLDESTELVFNLIDKLTDEMLERQKMFSRLGVQRIDQIDTTTLSKPLPVIFVILDEFSIMSQQIQEDMTYKLRLQNILAKGAALGIKFIFSSQTFTNGVRGLTPTARVQIQQRIAMKSPKEEIVETLDLSQNLKTEQVKNWIDALPPHYALVKFYRGADIPPEVKRFYVMYFKDYDQRDVMIDKINAEMKKTNEYCPNDNYSYVDKNPVLVDGNSYDKFDKSLFQNAIRNQISELGTDYSGDEIFVSFGTPRLMTNIKLAVITPETRENILLIGRMSEQSCVSSIIMSTILSFRNQGKSVELWAYGKNKLFRSYNTVFSRECITIHEGIDSICDRIRYYKECIKNKQSCDSIIIMVGMDRICMDFGFIDGDENCGNDNSIANRIESIHNEYEEKGLLAKTKDEIIESEFAKAWNAVTLQRRRELKAAGKSREEIKEILKDEIKDFREKFTKEYTDISKADNLESESKIEIPNNKNQCGAYNAYEDLAYITKFGSRLGYHFMMTLNSLADLKLTKLKLDLFRYKMTFQVSAEDSIELGMRKTATQLPEHICQLDDSLERFSFRPYLHKGITWDGWLLDENDNVVSPFQDYNY